MDLPAIVASAPPPAAPGLIRSFIRSLLRSLLRREPPEPELPTPLRIVFAAVVGIMLAGGGVLVAYLFGTTGSALGAELLFFAAAACLTPSLVAFALPNPGHLVRALSETALLALLLELTILTVLGTQALTRWTAYAIGLLLLLDFGGHFLEWYSDRTIARLARDAPAGMQLDLQAFKAMFHSEQALYIPLPLGLLIGVTVGTVRAWPPSVTLAFCGQLVLALAALILTYFLVQASLRLSDALLRPTDLPTPSAHPEVTQERSLFSRFRNAFHVFLPPPSQAGKDQEKTDLALALLATDLRRIYLYDSVHNVLLVVAFASAVASLQGTPLETRWLATGLVVAALVFTQAPYVLGQSRLHEQVLQRYQGVKRAEKAEELRKHVPLFPKSEFLTALVTTGSAGGMVYFLADQALKGLLK